MNYFEMAKGIVENVGGSDNIKSLVHCATRLRFELVNDENADTEGVRNIPGVISVVKNSGQYQVVIGNEVSNVYDEIMPMLNNNNDKLVNDIESSSESKKNLFDRFIDTISGIIVPVLPILTSAGVLKGILAICTALNLVESGSGIHLFLHITSDAFFYFMPVVLGFSVGRKFNANPYTIAVLGAVLIYPDFLALFNLDTPGNAPIDFFGIPVIVMNYTASIFPIIIGGWFASKVEHFFKNKLPKSLNLFLPLFVLVISVPVTLLAFGPLASYLSSLLAQATDMILGFSPILAGLVLGATWQAVVMLGLHWAFIPIMINNINVNGMDPLNAIFICTVFAQTGAALGVALKTKDTRLKALGYSCTVSGLFGVTEPAIYGITLPYKKPFITASIAGGIAGAIPAAFNARTYSFGGAGLFGIPQLINPEGLDISWTTGLISIVVAFILATLLTYLFGYNDKMLKTVN
ncbi:MAG: PTS transporter subunit EIIC [Enterococcus faecium]